MIEVAALLVVVAGFGLVAWRWYLDSRAADRGAQRAHELALRAKVVEADAAAIAEDRIRVRKLEERVRSLEFRPPK